MTAPAPIPGLLDQLVIGDPFRPLMPGETHFFSGQDPLDMLDAVWEDAHGRLPHELEDPIPDWVLADARELGAAGVTLRKIATAVLPVTGCPDVPSCEEILAARLAGGAARPVV